ncbi:LLM class flavin-dependent oxidoreductase [Mycolicibacterium goodii]|uniref:LLM class flavin-dependent oxidoreductase n=1 Tax=Mycolicibacterium goodii TaxID=134601 RepID=A0ABS6HYG1_MYCGD|nr:LLM class flavin-dependent oxidoreductase [Mycolicibacterium goodii]MBU8841482.1 LLM class flavin-dependent oxidoreductase [Mycolicibacterium goodii]
MPETMAGAKEAESMGFNRIGIWDSPALYREPWVALGAIATATTSVRIGPWVTNPLTRHPAVTAAAMATLDDLAPGRVILGIGTGDSGVYNLGGQAASFAGLANYIAAVRDLITHGEAHWNGARISMAWAAGRSIPIIASAHSTRALRTLAGVADGLVVGLGVHPEIVEQCMEIIGDAAEASGRDPGDLETWWLAPWYLAEDSDAARDAALWRVTAMVHHWPRSHGRGKLLPADLVDRVLELGSHYDMNTHGHPTDEQKLEYAAFARKLGIADYLISRFTFSGTPDDIASQIRASYAAGATNLDCTNPVGHNTLMTGPRVWASKVAPLISDLSHGSRIDRKTDVLQDAGHAKM